MVNIIQQGDPVLRTKASEVPVGEICGKKIQKILSDMKTALDSQKDGVAIAAAQMRVSLNFRP